MLIEDPVDLLFVEFLLDLDLLVEAVDFGLELLESELFEFDLGGEFLVGGYEFAVVLEEELLFGFELLDLGLEREDLLGVFGLHGLEFVDEGVVALEVELAGSLDLGELGLEGVEAQVVTVGLLLLYSLGDAVLFIDELDFETLFLLEVLADIVLDIVVLDLDRTDTIFQSSQLVVPISA